ncbi:putative aspartic proteinase GIP2 [Capsicum galapagoense]
MSLKIDDSTKVWNVQNIIRIRQLRWLHQGACRPWKFIPVVKSIGAHRTFYKSSAQLSNSAIELFQGGLRINLFRLLSSNGPYETKLATSIYNAVTKAFVAAIPKEVRSVPPVEPFTTCFNSRDIRMSRLGFNAPEINIGLHKKKVHWTITGANSLVKVNEDVVCLAFVERRTRDWGQAFIIGSYQMQDNLVEFDISRRRIGFSNSLFFHRIMCTNQNYT